MKVRDCGCGSEVGKVYSVWAPEKRGDLAVEMGLRNMASSFVILVVPDYGKDREDRIVPLGRVRKAPALAR